jgi:glycosyltransferase involved in cell wall biosynthesis
LRYIQKNGIRLIHAHGSSLFIASAAKVFARHTAVVWHNHYGELARRKHARLVYRLAVKGIDGVIAVNDQLLDWTRSSLHVPPARSWYLENFVSFAPNGKRSPHIPGTDGFRVVSVANIRPEKDQLTLVRAFALVVRSEPRAHLLIVGGVADQEYHAEVQNLVSELHLSQNVSFLGYQSDVRNILAGVDVAVVSSRSEGLPMALLEYGVMGLAVVATKVGQIADVLDHGAAGTLVEPSSPQDLAREIHTLITSPARRLKLGRQLRERVREKYSESVVVRSLIEIYGNVLKSIRFRESS